MDFKDSKVKTLFDFADIHENIEKKLEKKSI
jgi:hypothetical protein